MTEETARPVVIAIGYDDFEAALEYGLDEAGRAGCGAHLVHVVHPVPSGPELALVAQEDVEKLGRETLVIALEKAHALAGSDVPVTSEMRYGEVVPTLVEAAGGARLVVLAHRELSRASRIITRSVANGVAAHAHVPVVSVPTRWRRTDATEPVVVVGVDNPGRATEVLRAAVGAARGRRASLRVVHTWSVPDPYETLVVEVSERERWTRRSVAEVTGALDSLGEATDGLQVDIEVHQGRPADALLEASRNAELVVVGRHDPVIPFGSHLGPVARAVLREATCPVLLANPRHRHHRH